MNKIPFSIRDDDIDFWSSEDILRNIYTPLFRQGIKITCAVIPFGVQTYFRGDMKKFYQIENSERGIGDNEKLIDYLRSMLNKKDIEIALHGYNHLYCVKASKKFPILTADVQNLHVIRSTSINNQLHWIPECMWKDEDRLRTEIKKGKEYVESLFSESVKIFVPPGNILGLAASRIVNEMSMDLSGLISVRPDRDLNVDYLYAYIKRIYCRIRFSRPYPFRINIDRHRELVAYGLTPTTKWEDIIGQFNFCKKMNTPIVLSIHSWEMKEHVLMYSQFMKIIEYFLDHNAFPVSLSQCYDT